MTVDAPDEDNLLRPPSNQSYPSITRDPSFYNPAHTFELEKEKHYQQQYGDIYFLRLATLKPAVEQVAAEAWDGFQIANDVVRRVDRVLDVRQGELCWVAGTVYMDMPLKPNILDDISKDHWISAPPPREKYLSPNGEDKIMLEDESGRLRLIGTPLDAHELVTGCIIAVMGTENADGDFEVVDVKLPDLPRQPQRWERDDMALSSASPEKQDEAKQSRRSGGKVAIVSGLAISGDEADTLTIDLLMEYLLGEATTPSLQTSSIKQITRLIIAGNSLAEATPLPTREDLTSSSSATATKKASKKYGYDSAAYNPAPTAHLDALLATLLPSLPVTLIPGATDPANVALPQQPIHGAMLPHSRAYAAPPATVSTDSPREAGWFDATTNPWTGDIQGWRFLGTGGQNVDDVFKYVEGDDRLEMLERMLRWRCIAPTAPDTLWCYPFQSDDPFTLSESPHVFFAGNQPRFGTVVVEGPAGQEVRVLAVPRFRDRGEVLLVDLETLGVEVLRVEVVG
ncbi:MAG: hypothetical protein M1817_003617 [Caeruleum heppii]|nr:MAG: hypothetical protein M1817_003617 [Caeruleum heppii]